MAQAIGRNIRTARHSAELTQEQLAAASGVSVQLVRRLEAGTANTTLGTLHAVSDTLGATFTELLDGY